MHVCVCARECIVWGSQKKASDLLELELQMAVSHLTWVLSEPSLMTLSHLSSPSSLQSCSYFSFTFLSSNISHQQTLLRLRSVHCSYLHHQDHYGPRQFISYLGYCKPQTRICFYYPSLINWAWGSWNNLFFQICFHFIAWLTDCTSWFSPSNMRTPRIELRGSGWAVLLGHLLRHFASHPQIIFWSGLQYFITVLLAF